MPEERICADCGESTLWARMKCRACSLSFDRPAEQCPSCGSSDLAELGRLVDDRVFYCEGCGPGERRIYRSSIQYPYLDHGLARVITSPAHHRQVCRELGVQPTHGETIGTWEDIADKDASEVARDEAAYAEMMEEATQGPGRGDYAKLQEHMPTVIREQMAEAREFERVERKKYEREVERALSRGRR